VFDGKQVNHLLDFSLDSICLDTLDEAIGRLSVSGVQEKLSAVVRDSKIVPISGDEQGRYILKPASDNRRLKNRKQMPANEHLTMQIAAQVFNIRTAENAIAFFKDNEIVYLTKRFDILPDGSKISQEDFASLAGKTDLTHGVDFKYSGNYVDVAQLIRKFLSAWPVEMERFFRQIVFNYLFGNDDAHLKNFSIQQTKDGDYILAPAYDLLNSTLHITDGSDFALDGGLFDRQYYSEIYDQKGHPCQTDFQVFGELIGLTERQIERVISDFVEPKPTVYSLIDNSFLSAEMKRMYRRSYDERLARFKRVSL